MKLTQIQIVGFAWKVIVTIFIKNWIIDICKIQFQAFDWLSGHGI